MEAIGKSVRADESVEPMATTDVQPPPFAELYEEHFDFVWRNLSRLGVRPAQLDDAAQEVFIAVHRRLAEFSGRSAIRTWLFQFVMRVAATQRRSARRWNPVSADEELEALPDERSALPDEQASARQAASVLRRLLGEIAEDRRPIFILAELEELSIPEVAEALGINVNTAYTRLRSARADFESAVTRERAREAWRSR